MEPREKFPKVTMSDEFQERANKILRLYLPSPDTIPEISNIVYAVEKLLDMQLGQNRKKEMRTGQ